MVSVLAIHGAALLSVNVSASSFPSLARFCNQINRSSWSVHYPSSHANIAIPSLQVSTDRRGLRSRFCRKAKILDENYPSKEATFDIKLPRRNLNVQFKCEACGERTQRKINRVAYERGTVFVQCAGCLARHKLVDNLGLITEYNLREE